MNSDIKMWITFCYLCFDLHYNKHTCQHSGWGVDEGPRPPKQNVFCLTTTPLWSESVNWLVSWSDGSVNRAALWKLLYCDIDDVAFCQTLLNMFSSSVSFTFLSVPHHKVYYQSVINIISPVMSSWTWRGLTEPFLFLNLFSQINQFYLYSTNSKVISWHFTCRVLFSV